MKNKVKFQWNKFLKPSKRKITVSIIVTILFYLFLLWANQSAQTLMGACFIEQLNCSLDVDYTKFLPIKPLCVRCTSLDAVIYQYLTIFVIPFIIIYLIYSILENKKKRKKK